jgi:hypothetical protein
MPLLPRGDADLQRAIFEAIEDGALLLVGADGTERPVGSPGEIGVGQSGLRLAKPVPPGVCPECGGSEHPGQPCPETDLEGREGSEKAAGTRGSSVVGLPSGSSTATSTGPTTNEKQFAFSLRTSLSDDEKRDALYSLLTALGVSVDNGDSSFAEFMVKMRIKAEVAGDLAARVRAIGTEPTITDV